MLSAHQPFTRALTGTLVLLVSCLAGGIVHAADQEIRLSTQYEERTFQIREGVFTTLELQDKFPDVVPLVFPRLQRFRTLRVSSSEFGIYPKKGQALTAYDFFYRSHSLEKLPRGGEKLVVHLEGREVPLDVTLIYMTEPGKPWMRKALRITARTAEGRECVVERIDVERLGYPQGGVEGGGVGQPIFLPTRNHFFGLEYPQGHNDWTGVITLSHYPGRAVGDGLESKSAVWGVAPDGEVKKEFLESYVPSFAVHYPPQPFANFNEAFNTGYSTNEAIAMQGLALLKMHLVDAGVRVDSYSVAQWEDYASVWQPSSELYPHGFAPVQKAAEDAGMGFGLWISLTGGVLDTHWGVAHGIGAARADEVNGPYCTADANYQRALKASLRLYLVKNRINFLWCDYNQFNCPVRGYPAGSPVALEGEVDGYIGILEFVHKTNPETRIEITTGIWLSPWWLQYADWVWLGGSDIDYMTPSGVPSLEMEIREEPPRHAKRYAEITYRDSVLWNDFHRDHDVFPAWGLKTHGFYNWDMIGGAPDPQAGIEGNPDCCDEPLDQWAEHVVTTLLRGISDWNLLLNLRFMAPEKWAYLVRALKWGRANWDILSTTQMVLGSPSKFEVYGYTHFRGDRGLILVRNPQGKEQKAEITLNSENGFWHVPSTPLKAQQIYPCEQLIPGVYVSGSRVAFELAPYESKVIELGEHTSGLDKLAIRACQEERTGADSGFTQARSEPPLTHGASPAKSPGKLALHK